MATLMRIGVAFFLCQQIANAQMPNVACEVANFRFNRQKSLQEWLIFFRVSARQQVIRINGQVNEQWGWLWSHNRFFHGIDNRIAIEFSTENNCWPAMTVRLQQWSCWLRKMLWSNYPVWDQKHIAEVLCWRSWQIQIICAKAGKIRLKVTWDSIFEKIR